MFSKKLTKKLFLIFFIAATAVAAFSLLKCAMAQTSKTGGDSAKVLQGLGKTAQQANLGKVDSSGKAVESKDVSVIIGEIAQWLLVFLGVIFLVLMVYAGLLWMTAAGNDEKISKSKSIMASAALGLFFVLAASAITYFVMNNLLEVMGK